MYSLKFASTVPPKVLFSFPHKQPILEQTQGMFTTLERERKDTNPELGLHFLRPVLP